MTQRIDLWEDNSGGLMLVDREAGAGWCGFERAQNERRLREPGRTEFTFASDVPEFSSLGDGSAYEAMGAADVASLYEREGEANAAVHVARWSDGKVEVLASNLGASARWYLDVAWTAIVAQAEESAAELLQQGWDPAGPPYELGAYPGDVEALEERLGQRRAIREERVVLEREIRARLRPRGEAA